MRIAGAIVAGGRASRLGRDKPFQPFRGGVLLDAVLERLAPQTDIIALNLRHDAADTARSRYDLPILLDGAEAGRGPLAGVIAALAWAETQDDVAWLATAPADTPFLPADLVAQLGSAARKDAPVYAHDGERAHYLCALWPIWALAPIRAGVGNGTFHSLRSALSALGAVECEVRARPFAFFNVNTPEDLLEAERFSRRQEAG